jgi:hypothetical protein
MEIRGRTVEAVQYGGKQIYTVHVKQKEGDCRRKQEPDYKCFDNCEDSLIVARFMEAIPISVKAIAPEEVKIGVWSPDLAGISDLAGMEALVKKISGYRLVDGRNRKSKILYFADIQVGHYNPCGFTTDINLFGEEIHHTMNELVTRIKEVHSIAKDVPMEALVLDKSIANTINDPAVDQLAGLLGEDLEELIQFLRQKKNEQN